MSNVRVSSRSRRLAAIIAVWCVLPFTIPGLRAEQNQTPPAQPATPIPGQAPSQAAAVHISMDQAVAMALEANLGLKSDRLNLAMASQNIAGARAAFRPTLASSFQRNTSDSPPSDFTQTNATIVSSNFVQSQSQVFQIVPWYGGRYSATWSGSRTVLSNTLAPFNPTLSSKLTLAYVQPLWRNFRIDQARFGLENSELQYTIADLGLQQQVVTMDAQVRQAYLRLVGAIAGRDVANQNMAVAQEALRSARAKIGVGTAAEIDAIQAEASVATNEESVITAESAIATAEDQLRALIFDPARPDYWQARIEPDPIEVNPRALDVDAAIKNALANRLDLQSLRRGLDITALNLKLNQDQVHPQVDFQATYQASGTGGTKFEYGAGFPPPILSQSDRSYGSALSDTFGNAYPSWTLAVNMTYPLGNTTAHAAVARTRIQAEQQHLDIQSLELAVVTEVRDAARQVQTNEKRVVATKAARVANERQLDAEQRKAAVGLSTTFDVLQKQTLLAQARTAELQAMIAYNQSLIDFDRVQKIR